MDNQRLHEMMRLMSDILVANKEANTLTLQLMADSGLLERDQAQQAFQYRAALFANQLSNDDVVAVHLRSIAEDVVKPGQ